MANHLSNHLTGRQIKAIQKNVYAEAAKASRVYPWRPPSLKIRHDGSINPYKILVSEIMLQQTQTARVIEHFKRFIQVFPTINALAEASLADVLRVWQGLGYNRRAKMLHACARTIVTEYAGRMPRGRSALLVLPGVGPYTAGAIRAFAFNEPDVLIETNIRTVYYHYFFTNMEKVHDRELLPLIEQTLDMTNPRAWYSALMDYGAALKQAGLQLNAKSAQYKKQTTFNGSDRQIRGAIVRLLSERCTVSNDQLLKLLQFETSRVRTQVKKLAAEGLITRKGKQWMLSE